MIHHIISDKESVDDFIKSVSNFGKDIHYHVLLPLMPHGRSNKGLEDGVFEYLQDENILSSVSGKFKNSSKCIPTGGVLQKCYS